MLQLAADREMVLAIGAVIYDFHHDSFLEPSDVLKMQCHALIVLHACLVIRRCATHPVIWRLESNSENYIYEHFAQEQHGNNADDGSAQTIIGILWL